MSGRIKKRLILLVAALVDRCLDISYKMDLLLSDKLHIFGPERAKRLRTLIITQNNVNDTRNKAAWMYGAILKKL